MNKLANLVIFAAGAAIGSVVTWKLVKTKYEQIAQEEIDSVKEMYSSRTTINNETTEENEESEEDPDAADLEEYENKIAENGYTNYSNKKEEKGGTDTMTNNDGQFGPYVISPDQFDENPDYDVVSLTYYADKVLTNEMDEVIEPGEIDTLIGLDSLETFGEYEDDSVFVRNDEIKTDFEILLDERNFYED